MRKVTEEQYKNALDEKKIREEMRVYWKDYFKNKKEKEKDFNLRNALSTILFVFYSYFRKAYLVLYVLVTTTNMEEIYKIFRETWKKFIKYSVKHGRNLYFNMEEIYNSQA